MSTQPLLVVLIYASLASVSVFGSTKRKINEHIPRRLDIVGGKNSTIEQHPYQVSIYFDSEFFGAGTILNSKWIITTADSVNSFVPPSKFNIWAGSTEEHSGNHYNADKIVFHPKYDNKTKDYNLALVRIAGPGMKFSPRQMSIEVASRPLLVGQTAVTSGWGFDPGRSSVFKELAVKRTKQKECKKHYKSIKYKYITKSMICASSHNSGPCLFDWGNPLVFRHKLVGVCSFYGECGDDWFPGVYNSMHASYRWVKRTIRNT